MSSKKISQLAVVAAVSVVAAVVVHNITGRTAQPPQTRTSLIQGLNPDTVADIIITANKKSIHLKRHGTSFVVTDKQDYPAAADRVNELFTELLDIKTAELITDKLENHPDLDATEDKAQTIVRLLDNDANEITGLVIGKRTEQGNAYARLTNSNSVYLCENIPPIRTSALDYIDQQMLSIKRGNIKSVTVTNTNGLTYTLQSEPNSTELTLAAPLTQGKKLSAAASSVFSALSSLRFEDVFAEGSEPNGLTFNQTYICELKDSTRYIIKLAKQDDKTYAQCSATPPNTKDIVINVKDTDEQLKEKEAMLLARQDVDKFNGKRKGWVYELPQWKAVHLTKPLDEILEDLETEEVNNSEE
ncbi:MAG: DUF4340 domain-containing protein [Phycisphaerae bacterium]|jgi:hypothetical protein